MAKVPLYNPSGNFLKTVEVDPAEIAVSVNVNLMQRAVVAYEANRRQGCADTKGRSEIKASTAKPWRQKGTGRARAGSRRSPLWRGGGTIFGPTPRDYTQHLPTKMKRNACAAALRTKVEDGELAFIEAFELEPAKTKVVARILANMGVDNNLLIGTEERDPVMWRCARNIPRVQVLPVDQVNAFHLLRHRRVLLTPSSFERLLGRVKTARGREKAK
ncbi:MAG: 50S ribosomal protein L4 [Planctomycetota bacterium]|jgi:large subunit ribosomal protein L4